MGKKKSLKKVINMGKLTIQLQQKPKMSLAEEEKYISSWSNRTFIKKWIIKFQFPITIYKAWVSEN